MNDFGVPASQIYFLNGKKGVAPLTTDFYDPYSPYLGNSNLQEIYDKNGGKCLISDQ